MLRYVLRTLWHSPGFTAAVVLILALGIGANTAVFSVVDAVLLRPMPYQAPEQIFGLREADERSLEVPMTANQIEEMRSRAGEWATVETFDLLRFNLVTEEGAVRLGGAAVSAGFFPMLGVAPVLGRGFSESEVVEGNNGVALLSYSLWKSQFGGDPAVIGRELRLVWSAGFGPGRSLGESFVVVGVLPEDFLSPFRSPDIWVPHLDPLGDSARDFNYLFPFARLTLPPDEAAAELGQIVASMPAVDRPEEEQRELGVTLLPVGQRQQDNMRAGLWVLLGAVGLLLLGACANVANLILARNTLRRREVAVRLALGSGHGRLVGWLLVEGAVLATLGGAAGVAFAFGGLRLLQTLRPVFLPRLEWIAIDGRVLAFTLLVSVVTSLAFGTLPALSAVRRAGRQAGFGGSLRGGGLGSRRGRLSPALVVVQVALAVVLLVGAGLLSRSLRQLLEIDLGFDTEDLTTFEVSLPALQYPEASDRERFHREARAALERLPGVVDVGLSTALPMSGLNTASRLALPADVDPGEGTLVVGFRSVTDGFFESFGVPLVDGRLFEPRDVSAEPRTAIVSREFAERFWGDESPVARTIGLIDLDLENLEVIGVVGDIRHSGPERDAPAMVYLPMPAAASYGYVVRTESGSGVGIEQMRRALATVDSSQPLFNPRTFRDPAERQLGRAEASAWLMIGFAGIALSISMLGLLSVLSFSVSRRRAELGLRMALGARPGEIRHLVLSEGLRLVLMGLAVGLIAAVVLSQGLASQLHEVSPNDPVTLLVVALLALVVSLPALLLPMRRALSVAPAQVLRND